MYKVIVSCKGLNANRGTLSVEFSCELEPEATELENMKKEVQRDHVKIYGSGNRQVDITVRKA